MPGQPWPPPRPIQPQAQQPAAAAARGPPPLRAAEVRGPGAAAAGAAGGPRSPPPGFPPAPADVPPPLASLSRAPPPPPPPAAVVTFSDVPGKAPELRSTSWDEAAAAVDPALHARTATSGPASDASSGGAGAASSAGSGPSARSSMDAGSAHGGGASEDAALGGEEPGVHEAAAPDPGGAEERDPQVATAAAGQAKQPAPTASTVAAAGAAPALAPSEEGAATTTEPAVEAAGEAGPACGEADEAAPSGGAVPAPGASAAAQAPPPGAALARGTAAPVQASRDPSAAATGYDDLLQGRYSPPKPSWSGLGAEEEFPSLGAAARGQRRPAAQAPAAQAPAAVPAAWGGSAWGGGAATLRSKLAAAAAPPGAGPATPPLAAAPLAGAPSPIELLEIEVGLRVPGDFTPDALRRRAVRRRTFEHRQPLLQRGRRTGNVMEGLSLHEHILSPAEQEQLVSTVDRWVELGHAGLLRGRTFTAPRKWMPGKGRITAQFGCCYNYAKDSQGREPGIIPEEVVEPLPPLLRALCARLVRWGVLPAAREPDSAIINVYDEGDCIPPHIDHLDFLRPFCTLSLCSEQPIMFAQRLVPRGPGLFVAGEGCSPALVPLPRGSCMVLDGYGGTHAMHCVPPVAARRISVTLRKMGAPHSLAVRQAVAEYEAHHRPVPRFWELADADRRAAAAAAAAGRGGIVVR